MLRRTLTVSDLQVPKEGVAKSTMVSPDFIDRNRGHKSGRDDEIVAQDKRGTSAVLGNRPPLNFYPSPREERAGRGDSGQDCPRSGLVYYPDVPAMLLDRRFSIHYGADVTERQSP